MDRSAGGSGEARVSPTMWYFTSLGTIFREELGQGAPGSWTMGSSAPLMPLIRAPVRRPMVAKESSWN